jgi:hypothetical protein
VRSAYFVGYKNRESSFVVVVDDIVVVLPLANNVPALAFLFALTLHGVAVEQVITVMFDRTHRVDDDDDDNDSDDNDFYNDRRRPFATEAGAEAWWHRNKAWLLEPNPAV